MVELLLITLLHSCILSALSAEFWFHAQFFNSEYFEIIRYLSVWRKKEIGYLKPFGQFTEKSSALNLEKVLVRKQVPWLSLI